MIKTYLTRPLYQLLAGSLVLCCLFLGAPAWSQSDWSEGLTDRQRFRVFPHVDSGLRALEQNRFDKARSEFERAASMVPDNPVIALYLAQSYADAGEVRQAMNVLDQQLQRTPDVEMLVDARDVYAQRLTEDLLAQAAALRAAPAKLREFVLAHRPEVMSPYIESVWLSLLADASTPNNDLLSSYGVEFAQNEGLKRELRLFMLVRGGAIELATQLIAQWPEKALESYGEVESLTFQLLAQDQPDLAIQMLTRALPWVKASSSDRQALVDRVVLAQARSTDQGALQAYLQRQSAAIKSASDEREWLELASAAYGNALGPLVAHEVVYQENRQLFVSQLLQRLEAGVPLPTGVSWPALLTRLGRAASTALIESLSYRLTQIDQHELAWQILMSRYPFEDLDPAVQTELMQRIAFLAQRNAQLLTRADRALLSVPLGSVELRALQAQTLALVSDCAGIVRVLGDWSPAYGAQQWSMLGNCYEQNQQSGLAQYAFEQAVKREPSAPNRRALAYIAFQNKDDAVALEQWQSVVQANGMNRQDWLAAVATAVAANDMKLAGQWLRGYEQIGGQRNARYWALKARWLSGSDKAQAIEAMQNSLALEPSAEHYVELAKWQGEVGQARQAIESLQAAIVLDPDNGAAQAQLGFALYSADDLQDARIHLVSALALRPNDVQVTQQLAYVDQKLGYNADAKYYIEQSVDHLLRYPTQELTDQQQETLFALRRMNEDLSRRWTLSFDALMGTGSSVSVQSPDPLDNFRSYSQLELDYRLGPQGINNGKTVSAYARVFGGSGNQNSVLPIYAPTLGVGLRVKPFSDQVIYFAVERQIPLDHGTSAPANTMLRASASFLNVGQYSDDWHPVGPGWPTQNLYLDAAYYLSDKAWSLIADYRYGYHHKTAMGQTIQPYARVVTQKISNESTVDIRVGAGVRWNLWANESRYSAYSSRYYIGFEVQGALQTYQSDRVTALLTMGARW